MSTKKEQLLEGLPALRDIFEYMTDDCALYFDDAENISALFDYLDEHFREDKDA